MKTAQSLVLRNRHFFLADVLISVFSAIASYVIRLEVHEFKPEILQGIGLFLIVALPVRLIIFYSYGMYARYWISAGPSELLMVAAACFVSSLLVILAILGLTGIGALSPMLVPRSIPVIDSLIILILVGAARFSLRAYHHHHRRTNHRGGSTDMTNVMIIGAGHTGGQVLDALEQSADGLAIQGFLDDDITKIGTLVRGVRVYGKTSELQKFVRKLDIKLAVIAIPSAPGHIVRHIMHACQEIGIEYKIVPGLYELVSGKFSVDALRPVAIDDLLRRAPVKLDNTDIQQRLTGRRVMITGAGGSIGAELMRQIARCYPAELLLVGHGEASLFAIEARLKLDFPHVPYRILLADVRDMAHMTRLFEAHHPQIVFHTAAHKHVPMLENNIVEAVSNNVMGSKVIIDLCNRFDVERMVLISTDKAVKPVNIMGRSKRVAELLVLEAALHHPQRFAVVRFGNVLGSRGSVVPIFQQQIMLGGPLTVTSTEMTRYFMSIPEAALLVLKASVLAKQGPLFVLNMGEPVHIIDLAHDLIRLNGLEPNRDIEVIVTRPRPGEKLTEALFWEYETAHLVEHDTIYAIQLADEIRRFITESVGCIAELIRAVQVYDEGATDNLLKKLVEMIPLDRRNESLAIDEVAIRQPKPATGTA